MRTRKATKEAQTVTRSGRVRVSKAFDKENAASLANQKSESVAEQKTKNVVESKKRGRATKVPEPVEVNQPALKKQKVVQEEVAPVPTVVVQEKEVVTRASRSKRKAPEEKKEAIATETVQPAPTRATRKAATVKDPVIPVAPPATAGIQAPAPIGRSSRRNNKVVEEKLPEPEKITKKPANKRKGAIATKPVQVKEAKEVKEQKKEAAAAPNPKLTPVPAAQTPVSPAKQTIAITTVATNSTTIQTPATKTSASNTETIKPQVPFQRSPVYLQQQQPSNGISSSPATSASATNSPPRPLLTVQNKPTTPSSPATDDPFQLMPLKPSRVVKKAPRSNTKSKSSPIATATSPKPAQHEVDDVYGFDFNESSEPPQKKAAPKKRRPAAAANKRAPAKSKVQKAIEPSGMRLWDEKDFKQRQRQIKVNVINKDFKPVEKPIPPPPQVQKQQQIRTKPQPMTMMNSTAKDNRRIDSPPPDIQLSDCNMEPEMNQVQQQPPRKLPNHMNMSRNLSNHSHQFNNSIPWRYSATNRNVSLAHHSPQTHNNVTMTSLNDSNAENFNPVLLLKKTHGNLSPNKKRSPLGENQHIMATHSRPLHTLQPQRSPMKELNVNDTVLVPRPLKQLSSPTKRVFGVENNFGFDSDNEEHDTENLAAKRRKMSEKIDSLKKFRHSLNVTNSSSPLAPMRLPRNVLRTNKEAPVNRQVAAIKHIFTSTPQQMKIRDAFKASTPIAAGGSRKQLQHELLDVSTTGEAQQEGNLEGHKLFESLTFEAPAKRNYSASAPRRRKKVDFYGFSDDEEDHSDTEKEKQDESETSAPRPRVNKKAKIHEEKLAKFVDEFNSMCEEVDQYELVIE